MTPVNQVVQQVVSRLGLGRKLDDYRIWQAWDEVVGSTIARNAQPVRLNEKRLVVAVRNSSWMHELSMLSRDLVGRCNDWMGRDVISEIFLVVGKIEQPRKPPERRVSHAERRAQGKPEPPPPTEFKLPGLAPETVAAFERLWQASRKP